MKNQWCKSIGITILEILYQQYKYYLGKLGLYQLYRNIMVKWIELKQVVLQVRQELLPK